jgi:hypothetical protein
MWDTYMSATYAVSGFSHASKPGLAGNLIAWLSEKVRRRLSPNWLLFLLSEPADELIVDRHGLVEIRRTLAGWSLETYAKGEPEHARAIALRRLGNFANDKNPSRKSLRIARPVVQTEEAAGRWLLRVAIPGIDGEVAAAAGRKGKVRMVARGPETLAVISVPGRPTRLAMQHAETAILHAIAATRWGSTGGAMLRLHAGPAVLAFRGRFEVAVPVAERTLSCWMPG